MDRSLTNTLVALAFAGLVLLGFGAYGLYFYMFSKPKIDREIKIRDNMRQISLGIEMFADVHKNKLPAPASYDEEHEPLLSWRVHLLPFLLQEDLYNEFHLDEPWDSDHNRTLIERIPEQYQSLTAERGKTPFLLAVGENSIFAGPSSNAQDRVKGIGIYEKDDLADDAFYLVDAAPGNHVIWTKPEDWDFDQPNPLEGVRQREEGILVVGDPFAKDDFIDPSDEASWRRRLPVRSK